LDRMSYYLRSESIIGWYEHAQSTADTRRLSD